jgi:hypothetical protein
MKRQYISRLKKLLLVCLIFISIISCEKWYKDDGFTFKKKPYYGNELRIDGIYYKYGINDLVLCYILYSDGVSFSTNWYVIKNDFDSILFSDNFKTVFKRNNLYSWGLFLIDSSKIKFEHYATKDDLNRRVYIKSGRILNDTTFLITDYMHYDGEDKEKLNDTFHFRLFSPKPDSSNSIVP